jgi:hypothetical protein
MVNLNAQNIKSFDIIINSLIEVLNQSGYNNRINYLEDILESVHEMDLDKYKKFVVNSSLFGGAGALWEIWIEDSILQARFNKLFIDLINEIERTGIYEPRINQIKSYMRIEK